MKTYAVCCHPSSSSSSINPWRPVLFHKITDMLLPLHFRHSIRTFWSPVNRKTSDQFPTYCTFQSYLKEPYRQEFVDERNIMPTYQTAYSKFHSNETALLRLYNDLSLLINTVNNGRYESTLAFNTLWELRNFRGIRIIINISVKSVFDF